MRSNSLALFLRHQFTTFPKTFHLPRSMSLPRDFRSQAGTYCTSGCSISSRSAYILIAVPLAGSKFSGGGLDMWGPAVQDRPHEERRSRFTFSRYSELR
ncbi:hypothetical protein BOTBODRAFT_581790 [Botryobasidium botryosum FD-172 SS1]|uniref:Uncharacterized protein n=1 Tax=Botryobasidium botryosum (strain FD-172 SS1) TaxID=930990 RepID=A0A067N1T2_BOTB1|nr:hypothetical protein BOTBODRAFT_581790 [Botryobasidium botryosum FD-172 SS1]